VALDEVYHDFADPTLFSSGIEELKAGAQNIFVFRSFSKIYGLAGLRVGYGAGSPELVRFMYRVRPPFDVSVVASAAALAAMEDRDFHERTLRVTREGKRYLYAEMERLGLGYVPSHSNFILVELGRDATVVYGELLRRGVIVRAGYPLLPTSIRVTVGTREQNERFVRALEQSL
jgi:histidinol-phosphate aminotransferase